jgi:cyclopropane-fatty-acyl-phospholipid synthase
LLHEFARDLGLMLMSTVHAEIETTGVGADDSPIARCREVLEALFGESHQRSFDVRFWDGALDRGNKAPAPFTLVLNRPAALRRMLLPPNELSLVEAYISGDVDVEGSLEAAAGLASTLQWQWQS